MANRKRPPSPPLSDSVWRADSWQNAMTGVNVAGWDKRRATSFQSKRITEFQAEDIWRGDDIIARAIETIPLVMLRNGFDINISDAGPSKEVIEPPKKKGLKLVGARMDALDASDVRRDMAKKCKDLNVVELTIHAMQTARALGGSALWMGIDETNAPWEDYKRLAKPLNFATLKDLKHLITLRPHECWATRWYNDPLDPNYGSPSHYMVQRDTMGGEVGSTPLVVHESRLIRFYGAVTSRRQMATNNGWGDSILLRFIEVVADFQSSYQSAALLITDFAQAVQKVEGLAELRAAGDDATIIRRAEMIAQARSIARTVIIDSKEEFTREQTPLSGLPELLDRLASRVAAAVPMPVALLLGESPAGLNATGDSDIRWFYDECANKRELHLRPRLERLLKVIFRCVEGPTLGVEPASWKLKFAPLWQATDKEVAERNYIQAQADGIYVDKQIVTPEEVAESRFGTDEWSAETNLDEELRDQMADAHQTMVDDAIAEGKVPQPSPVKAAGQQAAVDLAVAMPPQAEEDPKAKPGDALKKKGTAA